MCGIERCNLNHRSVLVPFIQFLAWWLLLSYLEDNMPTRPLITQTYPALRIWDAKALVFSPWTTRFERMFSSATCFVRLMHRFGPEGRALRLRNVTTSLMYFSLRCLNCPRRLNDNQATVDNNPVSFPNLSFW